MKLIRLGSACTKIGSGATPRGGGEVYLPHGVTLIRSQNVYNDGFRTEGLVYIGEEHAAQLANVAVEPSDILLNITGDSVARSCRVPGSVLPARVNQHVAIIRTDPNHLDPGYLHYHLISPAKQSSMLSLAGAGATRNALTKGMIENFEVPAPTIVQQRIIAAVLGSLDDKIEHNRKTATKLEELARAIFRTWFVDFEPVRAKADGVTSFPSMPEDVFDSLPTRFVDSEIGPVPEGWAVRALSEVIDVNPTRSLRRGECAPYLDMKAMPTKGYAPESWIERPFGSGMRFTNGDTLVARITPCLENGKTAFVDFLANGQIAWGSTEYIVLRPKAPLPPIFAYCLARTGEFRDFAIQNMTGTSGRQRVTVDAMDHYRIATPSAQLALEFGDIAQPLFNCIRAVMDESRKLAEMRDYLLPKLVSGEIHVAAECDNRQKSQTNKSIG